MQRWKCFAHPNNCDLHPVPSVLLCFTHTLPLLVGFPSPFFFLIIIVYAHGYKHAHVSQPSCAGQKTSSKSQFSPLTRVPGMDLAGHLTLPTEPSHQTLLSFCCYFRQSSPCSLSWPQTPCRNAGITGISHRMWWLVSNGFRPGGHDGGWAPGIQRRRQEEHSPSHRQLKGSKSPCFKETNKTPVCSGGEGPGPGQDPSAGRGKQIFVYLRPACQAPGQPALYRGTVSQKQARNPELRPS